jgi:hypothetical protein
VRAAAPSWVIKALNNISSHESIGFEEDAEEDIDSITDKINDNN